MSHPIENIMRTTMEQLKEMVDVNTIIGDPIVATNGSMILPISRVSLGFLSGGGEYNDAEPIRRANQDTEIIEDIKHPFAGVSAAGISLTPMAVLVVEDVGVKILPANFSSTYDRIIEMIPQAVCDIIKLSKKPGNTNTDPTININTETPV